MRLYLAHAASDLTFAAFLKTELERLASGISVFVASRPGDIPTGSDWLKEIHGNLRLADAFLFLLTPRSVERPWVWYEAGAAWFSDKRRIHVATAGLDRGDIPYPLGAIQTLQIDQADDAVHFFKDFGAALDEVDSFIHRIHELGNVATKLALT